MLEALSSQTPIPILNTNSLMKTNAIFSLAIAVAGGTVCGWGQNIPAGASQGLAGRGKTVFDNATFGGNGRTCATCHSQKTGTFSIEEAQARFAKDPGDPLFRQPDSDLGDAQTYDRLLTTGTIRIDVPLAPNVRLLDDPNAMTVSVFRATPTVKNVTTLVEFLMSDGRESSDNLQHQALGAVHQHSQNASNPPPHN